MVNNNYYIPYIESDLIQAYEPSIRSINISPDDIEELGVEEFVDRTVSSSSLPQALFLFPPGEVWKDKTKEGFQVIVFGWIKI